MSDPLDLAPPKLAPISLGGGVTIVTPVLLAPMAGVTDQPFRRLVQKFGAGLVFSEMIASQAMIREVKKTLQMVAPTDEKGIHAVQIAGSDAAVMAEAARLNEARGAQIIDINFGCPVKKIVNGEAGAALMKDEVKAGKILEAVVRAVAAPVTLKMRLGWSVENLNAPRLAHIAQESGVRMMTVHGRTRNQFYHGTADWAAIRKVRDAMRLPLIANGDITCEADVVRALALSGADGVMIGRGTYGRPWLLAQIMAWLETGKPSPAPSLAARYATLREHFEAMLSSYGTQTGLRIARKHLGWYSKGLPQAAEFRSFVNVADDAAKVAAAIDAFFQPLLDRGGE